MSHSFPKSSRLLKRAEFLAMRSVPNRKTGRFFVVSARASPFPSARLGITVTKKFGIAAERNRIKRQVREIFRTTPFPKDIDLHVVPRKMAKKRAYKELCYELVSLVRELQFNDL